MSPLIDPVVCRATSGAQSPSSGGLIVLHQTIKRAKASAKSDERDPALRGKSATVVPKPRSRTNRRGRPLGFRRRKPKPQRQRAPGADGSDDRDCDNDSEGEPRGSHAIMNLAPFLAASRRPGARLNEAETRAKPYHFTPCRFALAGGRSSCRSRDVSMAAPIEFC